MRISTTLVAVWLGMAQLTFCAMQTSTAPIASFKAWRFEKAPPPNQDDVMQLAKYVDAHPDDGEASFFLATAIRERLDGTQALQNQLIPLLESAVKSEYKRARPILAYEYLTRIRDHKQRAEAMSLLNQSLADGDPYAEYVVGLFSTQGMAGFPIDLARAEQLLKHSAENGITGAYAPLGLVQANLNKRAEAIASFEQGVNANDPQAMAAMADLYRYGKLVPADPVKAFNLMCRAVDLMGRRRPDFVRMLASYYEDGIGTETNQRRAFDLYRSAYDSGDKQAGVFLARMYLEGRGTDMDIHQGIEALRKLAAEGIVDAQVDLGKGLLEGVWIDRDVQQARSLFERAAQAGNATAKQYLMWMHLQAATQKAN
jgi:TPR repeat protein